MISKLLVILCLMVGSAYAASVTQCPSTGNDTTGCEYLITYNPDGSFTTTVNPGGDLGPYDGCDDTLIGVQNNNAAPLLSLPLSSSLDIFGFDGDGVCSGGYLNCSGSEPNGYGGFVSPTNTATLTATATNVVTYSGISIDATSGTVNFGTSGIAPGGSAFFSLEEAVTVNTIGLGTPEPATFGLIGIGLTGLYFVRRRVKG
jgi:PEP-CTERM motif